MYTRGYDMKGRVYASTDGLNYTFLFDHYNYNAPQTLNQGLDGSIYLMTNRGPGLLRNPLAGVSAAAARRSWNRG